MVKQERYVLDQGSVSKIVMYVNRKDGKIVLTEEYYSPKPVKELRTIDLQLFENIAHKIIFKTNPFSEELEQYYTE